MTFLRINSFVDNFTFYVLCPIPSLTNKLLVSNLLVERKQISEMMLEKATTRRLEALLHTCRTPGKGTAPG